MLAEHEPIFRHIYHLLLHETATLDVLNDRTSLAFDIYVLELFLELHLLLLVMRRHSILVLLGILRVGVGVVLRVVSALEHCLVLTLDKNALI